MWQRLISIIFISQMCTCLSFFYIYKLFIHSSLLSFIIEHRSILIFGLIMHFPAESRALFKSVGDKTQADYLTAAIKEPCELLWLVQGSLVKPLAGQAKAHVKQRINCKMQITSRRVQHTTPNLSLFNQACVACVTFYRKPLVFMSYNVLFFYFFIFTRSVINIK